MVPLTVPVSAAVLAQGDPDTVARPETDVPFCWSVTLPVALETNVVECAVNCQVPATSMGLGLLLGWDELPPPPQLIRAMMAVTKRANNAFFMFLKLPEPYLQGVLLSRKSLRLILVLRTHLVEPLS